MGGPRYEQFFRATGTVLRRRHQFTGTGLRIRRQGVRKLAGSGATLAVGGVPQRKGLRLYRLSATPRRRADVQRGLHLHRRRRFDPRARRAGAMAHPAAGAGEDVSVVLETGRPCTSHRGRDGVLHPRHPPQRRHLLGARDETGAPDFPALQQAGVRYHWDGEQTYGMLERSNPVDKITWRHGPRTRGWGR